MRINISLDLETLTILDQRAGEVGLPRSTYISLLVRKGVIQEMRRGKEMELKRKTSTCASRNGDRGMSEKALLSRMVKLTPLEEMEEEK